MTKFADSLARIAQTAGVSQRELARQAGLTQSHVSKLMLGKTQPNLDTLLALAKALGCTPEELIGSVPVKKDTLTARERRLVEGFRQLPDGERKKLIEELLTRFLLER